jgi:MFS transporter, PAT family, beta-lactamase induction signal transducer AmpG
MNEIKKEYRNGWTWVPSLYFAEGLPYMMVMTVSVIMYKRLGISNTDIALYTSLLYLPWVIKPFWSPFVDIFKTKRFWILLMQLIIAIGLGGIAYGICAPNFFTVTLAFFWLLAFGSATHDIAADGFYMLGLTKHDQVWFVGFRSTFYRFAMIFAQGLLVILAGYLEKNLNDISAAWKYSFLGIEAIFFLLVIYHSFILPSPASDKPTDLLNTKSVLSEFLKTFVSFFQKKQIIILLLFILFYRFGEAQLAKLTSPFLLDSKDAGGLALSTESVGFIYGTVGVIALTFGGILGGFLAARNGLKYWLWWMLIAINLPDLVYVYLSVTQTTNLLVVNIMVALEQFGYGFGFTAFLLILIYISEGEHKTAHYAIATGLMALGMMLPGLISGWVQSIIGYKYFFVWVTVSTIPAFIITSFLKIDPEFGKKINGK